MRKRIIKNKIIKDIVNWLNTKKFVLIGSIIIFVIVLLLLNSIRLLAIKNHELENQIISFENDINKQNDIKNKEQENIDNFLYNVHIASMSETDKLNFIKDKKATYKPENLGYIIYPDMSSIKVSSDIRENLPDNDLKKELAYFKELDYIPGDYDITTDEASILDYIKKNRNRAIILDKASKLVDKIVATCECYPTKPSLAYYMSSTRDNIINSIYDMNGNTDESLTYSVALDKGLISIDAFLEKIKDVSIDQLKRDIISEFITNKYKDITFTDVKLRDWYDDYVRALWYKNRLLNNYNVTENDYLTESLWLFDKYLKDVGKDYALDFAIKEDALERFVEDLG